MKDAAGIRRRHLTGSRAHRLSNPEREGGKKLQLDVTITGQSHDEEHSRGGSDGGIPRERANKNPTQRRASDPFSLKIIINSFPPSSYLYVWLRLPIGLFTQA